MSIKFENTEVIGWEAAIRGMRNPMNSWEKSDTTFYDNVNGEYHDICGNSGPFDHDFKTDMIMGYADLGLMKRLRNAGTDHRKFMRMITVYVDITAPLYWWKEFDTYKVGTVANSCSTMHKIHEKKFTLEDFSHEHLTKGSIEHLDDTINTLNDCRYWYMRYDAMDEKDRIHFDEAITCKEDIWWQMIQLLPSSYNQKRTVMMNYEVLANIYKSRKNHKLDEWSIGFMNWINDLPYSELITGIENE